MLWIPDKKTLKALARTKRRRRRRKIARVLLFVLLIFLLSAAAAPPKFDLMVQVNTLTTGIQFDFVDWISQAVAGEIGRRIDPPVIPATNEDQQVLIQTYLEQEEQIRVLEDEIEQIYATDGGNPNADIQEQKLARLKTAQAAILPQVETILSRQIEAVLRDEGFNIAGQVFPPVAFRLVEPPTTLIISPRDRIERQHMIGLAPGLEIALRSQIEDSLNQRGDVSNYVTNIGGLGSYPTMVVNHPWLPWLVDTVAHEWTHNYLYTFPSNIAWGYGNYPRLTTINETTASLVGEELSRKVITRFYPNWIKKLPPLDANGQPTPNKPSEFELAMRNTRRHVDALLAEGKIDEAEKYMEAERVKLA